MKRFITLLVSFYVSISFAQNSFPPSGNVGIGTSSPKTLLDVNGTALIREAGLGALKSFPAVPGRRWFTNSTSTNYTEFVETGYGGAAALIFNGYMAANGSLTAAGTVKYATSAGAYTSGAGMMTYTGNGGGFNFYISPISTGIDSNASWLPVLRMLRSQSVSMYGSLDLTAANPEIKLISNNPTSPVTGIRGNNNAWIVAYKGSIGNEELIIGNRTGSDNRSISMGAGGKEQMKIAPNGNITLGNALNPATSQIQTYSDLNLNGKSLVIQGSDGFRIKYDNNFFGSTADAAVFEKIDGNSSIPDGGIAFVNSGMDGVPVTSMVIKGNGDIGIGTKTPTARLSVNGQIKATSVKVLGDVNLPDYVFKKEYKLRKIESVEAFIQENGHLPDVPSAKDVSRNGLDVGEMSSALLKKIEELTLYIIEQQKEISSLKKAIGEIKGQ